MIEFFRKSFSTFLENDDNAEYNADKKCWTDLRNFQIALRSAVCDKLSKIHLNNMMKKFEGGENPEEKGKFNPAGGEIFVKVTTSSSLPHYAFFRVLSKQWHYVSMARKEDRLTKKADEHRKRQTNLVIKKEAVEGKQKLVNEMIRDLEGEISDIKAGELAFYEDPASAN
jgi:hypothetical protein